LELEKANLTAARSTFNLHGLDDRLQETLHRTHESLSGKEKEGAEAVFQQALKSLNEAEAQRFVINNVLESLKNGGKMNDILDRYGKMGLVNPVRPNAVVEDNPFKTTQALLERKSMWERFTSAVSQIAVNAVRSVPKWIELEPHVKVFPVPGLSFALKAKGMTAYELFETLRGAHVPPPAPNS
jgi:hypothetical protein